LENQLSANQTATLLDIWKRLLHKEQIGIDEGFFELGGDSEIAVQLFREIEKSFGRKLPPVVIYQAPTISSQAALIEAPSLPPFSPCVLLKAGDVGHPVFLLHGIDGTLLEFFDLVRSLETQNPIYGLQARGADGLETPCSRIEEMAQFHIDAIRNLQPHGPYQLVGYSLGGLVAFEMARRLAETGESTELLVMIDSYPALSRVPLPQRMRVNLRKALYYLYGGKRQRFIKTDLTPAMKQVGEAAAVAIRVYEPNPYRGGIRFVRAARPLYFPDDPVKVWAPFVDRLEVQDIPGDHHGMLTTHYKDLAAVISHHLLELSVEQKLNS
jgi:acetoacetyl-CoA synthetase